MLRIHRHRKLSCPAREREGEGEKQGEEDIKRSSPRSRCSMPNSRRRLCVERKFPVVAEGESVIPPHDGQGDDRKERRRKGECN